MPDPNTETIVLGGGCFWCTEAVFSQLRGVREVVPGYAGGRAEDANYETVSSGATDHVEVIRVIYEPAAISVEMILNVFFATHDPTTPNRQGHDVGRQYRSVIFYTSDTQKEIALRVIRALESARTFSDPIVTEVVALPAFHPAEEYHQRYYENNARAPYCQAVIAPKLEKLHHTFEAELVGTATVDKGEASKG